jgi:CheY-like chemotaxis protein/two-component sensor histidine kinase
VRDYGRTLRQLDLLAETAQAASQSKTRFFAAASHDLRQPLHALAINATTLQLVARKYNEPLITELSQSINRALRQGNGLLDGLLDISRLDANAVRVTIEPIEGRGLLAQVCEEFKGVAAQRGIQLRVGHTLADDFWMATDAELMLRMVNNLVNNAIKFTSVGAVTLSARRMPAAVAGEPDDIVLRVEDSGCGIPSAERQRVFEEFYQIGNPSRDQSRGLGLGLSIVQRSAALLKVRVSLDSREGEGTTVELRVPGSVPPPPMPMPRGGPDDPAGVEELLRKGLRVLVVDDEDMILQSLAGLLPLLGCEARFAHDLPRAMRALDAGFVPDVLLIDQRLNGESGTDVIVALRERLGPVPALVVTGETAPIPLQNALSSGCRVIHKPVDGPRLARALAEITADVTA